MSNTNTTQEGEQIVQDVLDRRHSNNIKFTKVVNGKTYTMIGDSSAAKLTTPYPTYLDHGTFSRPITAKSSEATDSDANEPEVSR